MLVTVDTSATVDNIPIVSPVSTVLLRDKFLNKKEVFDEVESICLNQDSDLKRVVFFSKERQYSEEKHTLIK